MQIPIADKHLIGPGAPTFIIAEAGINHNGDLAMARQLIDAAVEARANAVKIQTINASRMVSPDTPKADYQKLTTDSAESQFEMLRRVEFDIAQHRELMRYCQDRNILFMSTPFEETGADLLEKLGVAVYKIPSGEITNLGFLAHVAKKGRPIILSTGMSSLGEIETALYAIRSAGGDQVVLLHCVSNYPSNPADANLRAMDTMARAFGVPVGFSDHSLGIEIPLAAVALGACVIEKHFTLDKSLPGPDHQASLDPSELCAMVQGIRKVEQSFGSGIKVAARAELSNRQIIRRSLHLTAAATAGTTLRREMLIALRPAGGIPPDQLEQVIGRQLKHDLAAGKILNWEDLI